MRRPWVRLLLALLSGGCGAQRAAAAVELPAEPQRAEVRLRLAGNLPVVQATVAGRSVHLLLDLGGFDTVALRPEVLADLPVAFSGDTRRWRDAGGKLHRSRAYLLPVVEIGGLRLEGVAGHDLPVADPTLEGLDGYLGLGLLRRFAVLVDFPGERLVLARSVPGLGVEGATEWPRIDAEIDDRGVVSRLRSGEHELRFVWDTGYTWSVVKPKAVRGLEARDDEDGQLHVTLDPLRAGGVDLGPLDVVLHAFRQPPVDGVLGYNVFAERAVWVDFAASAVGVAPRAPAGD